MIGEQIDGKYVVTGQLGAGAMGAVYAARNIATGRAVAVKVIQNGLGTDGALVARFQREARAAGAIQSTYIAQILDAGQDRTTDAPYLVMELLEGEDLDTLVRRLGAVRYDLALRIIAQALAGLERAHAVGVVHRDIKPANLYIARVDAGQRVVKLVDFGIAKVKDEFAASNHALTQTSALLGSPLYMSPEQAKASKKVDARADLWSLGIVLYQLLTGHAPHSHAESLTELLLAICTEDVKPVQQAAPWVPAEVAAIVERALRLDPTKRYDDAKQMRDDIAAIVPDWQVLGDAMLTPLTSEERSLIAQPTADFAKLAASTGPTPEGGRGVGASASAPGSTSNSALALGGATELGPMPQSSASQHSAPALAASAGASGSIGREPGTSGTDAGVTGSGLTRSGGPRTVLFAAVGGFLLVVAAVGGMLGLRSHGKTGEAAAGMIAQPSAAAASVTASAVAREASGTASAAPASASVAPSVASADSATRPGAGGVATQAGMPRARPSSTSSSSSSTSVSVSAGASARPTAAPTRTAAPATTSSSPISREFN